MTISVTNIGTNSGAASPTLAITVPAGGVPAGSLIYLGVEENASVLAATATDTASNTYTSIQSTSGAQSVTLTQLYVKNCTALAQNNTITVTAATSGDQLAISACYATGIDTANPLDTAVTAVANGNSSSPSVTSGTPAVAGELFFGSVAVHAGMSNSFSQASGWATPPNQVFVSSTVELDSGNQVNSGSGALTYNPTIASAGWVDGIVAFKPASAARVISFDFAQSPVIVRSMRAVAYR